MTVLLRVTTLMGLLVTAVAATGSDKLHPYVTVIEERGQPPAAYVVERLRSHDLLLFDDFNHQAKEPFDFYASLVADPAFQALRPTLYIELFKVNEQPHIDAFLTAAEKDLSLLHPVFQSTYTPYAYPMKSYFDLMEAVYDANTTLADEAKLRVVAVSTPSLWPSIETAKDYAAAQKSLAGRDHDMYRTILDDLEEFENGRKGIFLTNTRHAYTGIRKKGGSFFWNTGTFFRQWHPGKSFSIRFHGPQLFIESIKEDGDARDQEGLSRKKYFWGRMEHGLWDSAFSAMGDRPVGFDLADTPFGVAVYAGNHMLDAAPGQTMQGAYDGLVFLKPVDDLTATAKVADMYTDTFVDEVERRLRIYRTPDELQKMMDRADVNTVRELVRFNAQPAPAKPLLPAGTLGPVDAWKTMAD